jgi:uncharacterized membrane protein
MAARERFEAAVVDFASTLSPAERARSSPTGWPGATPQIAPAASSGAP